MSDKVAWHGEIVSVQPRIRLTRSFDQRHHSYLGYVLAVRGTIGAERREFQIGIGPGAQEKHEFEAGVQACGESLPVGDPRLDPADYHKTSGLKVLSRSEERSASGPPGVGRPPILEQYRQRGHRRLDPRTFSSRCRTCLWGCRMTVEMIVDHWNPSQKQYRFETFCYGPKSCSFYRPGSTRKVPGRRGMTWEEEDWVDEEATAHRGPDD